MHVAVSVCVNVIVSVNTLHMYIRRHSRRMAFSAVTRCVHTAQVGGVYSLSLSHSTYVRIVHCQHRQQGEGVVYVVCVWCEVCVR